CQNRLAYAMRAVDSEACHGGLVEDRRLIKHEMAAPHGQAIRSEPNALPQEAIHLARIANARARDTSLHPAADLGCHTVSEDRLHSKLADALKRESEALEAAEFHQLELDERDRFQRGCALDIGLAIN